MSRRGTVNLSSRKKSSWGSLSTFSSKKLAGRKSAIQIGAVIWIIGCIIVSAAQNIPMLIVGRIINGFCVGICSAQVPVYITEIAPPTKRGRLVGAQQWAITWGIMIMFYISYGCSFINGNAAFRVPWALQMIPAIILFFGMIVLPESPRWLASKDRWEECEQVLILTHGKGDPHSPWVAREFQEIREWIDIERASAQVRYIDLFSAKYINRTHIGLFTQIWSQLTGMNVMMYYITYVFAMAGLTGNTLLGELHHSFLFLSTLVIYHFSRARTLTIMIFYSLHIYSIFFHSICHQRRHDHPRFNLDRSRRPSTHPLTRIHSNGNLALCQRRNSRRLRHRPGAQRCRRYQRSFCASFWCSFQSCYCLLIFGEFFLLTYLPFQFQFPFQFFFLLFFTFTPYKPTELTHNPSSSSPPTHPPGVPSPGSILPNYIPTISAAKPLHSPPLVRSPPPPHPPQKSSSPPET